MKSNNLLIPGVQLPGVDIMKYLMALGVVAIHVASGSCCGIAFPDLMTWFIRLAVPFFFVTSGFLLQRELTSKTKDERNGFLRLRCVKIFKLFISWILIYLPISLILFPYGENPIYKLIVSIVISILVKGEISYAWPLWFLYSLLLISLGFWATNQSKVLRNFFILTICVFYLAYQSITYLEPSEFPYYVQILYKFLPIRALGGGGYLLCGIVVYNLFSKIANVGCFIGMLVISLLLFFNGFPLFELFGGVAVFLFATFITIGRMKLSHNMRIQSMWIYYLHMYAIFAIVMLSRSYGIRLELWPTYIIVLTITMIVSYLLSKLQLRPKFRFLTFLTK